MTPDDTAAFPLAIAFLLIGLGMYFAPTLVANFRHRSNAGAIFALNLFLGWTMIGWVCALVWALTTPVAVERR